MKLEDVEKDTLIKIIAHFADSTNAGVKHDLQNYCSVPDEVLDEVFKITELCKDHCVKNDWILHELNTIKWRKQIKKYMEESGCSFVEARSVIPEPNHELLEKERDDIIDNITFCGFEVI